jgi:hypothetical protein
MPIRMAAAMRAASRFGWSPDGLADAAGLGIMALILFALRFRKVLPSAA